VITFQTSSLGKIVPRYLSAFYEQLTDHKTKEVAKQFKVVFPTEDFVNASHLGVEMASSVLLQEKFWDEVADYPKESFHRLTPISKALDGNLFHAKIMVVNDEDNTINDDSLLYFGSHNFSPSAWGNVEKRGSQIHMANWELGIIFPPGSGTASLKSEIIDAMTLMLCSTTNPSAQSSPPKYDLRGVDMPFILEK
jgi:tyrosyl-DNA phosphodiesterase-1